MKHIKKIKIDIDKKNFEVIPSVQYDSNTRYLHIQLLNDSVPFDITGCSVILSGVKEDGNSIFNSCDIINSEIGFIQTEVTEQMNAIPGYIDCEIKIYNGEGVLTSKKFTIKVTASQTSREVVSSNEFKALTDAIKVVQGIDNKADKNYVDSNKRDKSNPITENDLDGNLLGLIQNGIGGNTVNVLSIPKNRSVTPTKTNFFKFSRNLFNKNDINIIVGKGFRGTTGNIVENAPTSITHFISVDSGDIIKISANGAEVPTTYYKVAFFGIDEVWKSTVQYAADGIIVPGGTFLIKVQYKNDDINIQIEKGSITSYAEYEEKLDDNFIPMINMDKLNILIKPENTNFFHTQNFLNKNDTNHLLGKGFSSFTDTIVDADIYNISGYIDVVKSDKIFITSNCLEVSNVKFFKISSYNKNNVWLKTEYYTSGGYILPTDTAKIRVSYYATTPLIQIEKNKISSTYEDYSVFLKKEYLPISPNKVTDKNFTSFGDSITFRNSWQDYVVSYFGLKHVNLGIGSTTLAYVESVENKFPCFINEARINAIKDSNPDIITILGGTNDCHRKVQIGDISELDKQTISKDKTLFIGAYGYLIETLLTWKPELQIILLTTVQSNWSKTYNYDYKPYVEATKKVAEYYGLPCIDLFGTMGVNRFNVSSYTNDGLHPNDLGGKKIANLVIEKFKSISYI